MGWARRNTLGLSLLGAYLVTWAFLAIDPLRRDDWILENLLVALTLPLLVAFHDRMRISKTSDCLLFLFYTLHAIGGHWSYSNVPFIPWESWGFERNHYDRIVHTSFGLLLWLPVRDALRRFARLTHGWAGVFALTVVFSLSAAYEVIEWGAVAVVAPDLGQEFLGAQGDEFDAAKDMALAFGGALFSFALATMVERVKAPAAAEQVSTNPAVASVGRVGPSATGPPAPAGLRRPPV